MMTIFNTAAEQFSYETFLELAASLLEEHKTTGDNQSEEYLHYSKLNLQRMKRWNKTYSLPEDFKAQLQSVPPQHWFVITEAWCGDSAQNLPVIAKIAAASEGKITLKIVLRDENPGIINQYLTNGSKSIPILAAFDTNGQFLFRWGPRPVPAQTLMTAWKNDPNPKPFEDFELDMHNWYNQNKGVDTLKELSALLLRG